MGVPNLRDSRAGRQVQAKAKRDYRADNERCLDERKPTALCFAGEVQATHRIRFPKINSRPKPVVIVLARFERLAFQDAFTDTSVAAVVAENEARR